MKTAKEMFEALGYELDTVDDNGSIEYVKDSYNVYYFDLDNREFYKTGLWDSECDRITFPEFKAIHQQMKELGWLDENNI